MPGNKMSAITLQFYNESSTDITLNYPDNKSQKIISGGIFSIQYTSGKISVVSDNVTYQINTNGFVSGMQIIFTDNITLKNPVSSSTFTSPNGIKTLDNNHTYLVISFSQKISISNMGTGGWAEVNVVTMPMSMWMIIFLVIVVILFVMIFGGVLYFVYKHLRT